MTQIFTMAPYGDSDNRQPYTEHPPNDSYHSIVARPGETFPQLILSPTGQKG